jgi:hypothetical protein
MAREQHEQITTDTTRIVDADPIREKDDETIHLMARYFLSLVLIGVFHLLLAVLHPKEARAK